MLVTDGTEQTKADGCKTGAKQEEEKEEDGEAFEIFLEAIEAVGLIPGVVVAVTLWVDRAKRGERIASAAGNALALWIDGSKPGGERTG